MIDLTQTAPAMIRLMLLLLLLTGCSGPVEMSELETRNDKVYRKDKPNAVYSGRFIEYYSSNNPARRRVYREGEFKMGLRHGEWVIHQWSGEKDIERYDMGKQEGWQEKYYTPRDGKERIKWKQEYKRGSPHGNGTYYDSEGEIVRNVYFVEGVQQPMPKQSLDDGRRKGGFWRGTWPKWNDSPFYGWKKDGKKDD